MMTIAVRMAANVRAIAQILLLFLPMPRAPPSAVAVAARASRLVVVALSMMLGRL